MKHVRSSVSTFTVAALLLAFGCDSGPPPLPAPTATTPTATKPAPAEGKKHGKQPVDDSDAGHNSRKKQ